MPVSQAEVDALKREFKATNFDGVERDGLAIEAEVWSMPVEHYGSFVAMIPAPLGIGSVELSDGSLVQGFLCEATATVDAEDITHFGGWRAYRASLGRA